MEMLQFTNSVPEEAQWAYPSTYTVKEKGYEIRPEPKKISTCHPSGFRFIGEDDSPVSKSVQLMVPSEDAE